jgi:galactokinase
MNKKIINHIKTRFKIEFTTSPILVFSPGRINLIGEHTDYNNGYVFPAAIDKGIVTAIQKSNDNISSVIAVDINQRYEFTLNNIQPLKNETWRNYVIGIVAEIQKTGKTISPFNLIFGGDIPLGAGLSSSAALENSIVFGLNELFELNLSKQEMIFISQKAEHNYVGVKCGIMDQYSSMFGQNNTAILLDCQSLEAKPVKLNLQDYTLLLINTNVNHSLAESVYNERRATCEKVASKLGIRSLRHANLTHLNNLKANLTASEYQKALYVIQENHRVLRAFEAINKNDTITLGKLLFESHDGLQNQYKVSCEELDFLVEHAKKSQAVIGARMMGGGFGGCTINMIETNQLEAYKKEVSNSYKQKFNNTCCFYTVKPSEGTKLI